MPKAKTRKSVSRRFRITKRGKVLRRQAFRRHLKASKSKKRLRNLKKVKELTGHFAKRIRKSVGK
ncbi:50S ribosomal protein L35 [Candidatus Woesebacteria bacterium]|nr:50S ribosomal protein L35 [Candidatus Woesebacteria bacterium]